jgi:hypothetical protein
VRHGCAAHPVGDRRGTHVHRAPLSALPGLPLR